MLHISRDAYTLLTQTESVNHNLVMLMKTCSIYITNFIRCNKCIRFKDDISSLRADLSPVKFRQQLVNHYFSLSLSSASVYNWKYARAT